MAIVIEAAVIDQSSGSVEQIVGSERIQQIDFYLLLCSVFNNLL